MFLVGALPLLNKKVRNRAGKIRKKVAETIHNRGGQSESEQWEKEVLNKSEPVELNGMLCFTAWRGEGMLEPVTLSPRGLAPFIVFELDGVEIRRSRVRSGPPQP